MDIPEHDRRVFAGAIQRLNTAGVPYVLAGAFCVHYYTGIWRYTKDLDLFVLPEDVAPALARLREIGFKTWIEADHWLGKATKDECMVDVIFGSGNWLSFVDAIWFERSRPAALLGQDVQMAPIEEMIWAKSYIAGRERYDAADICHLIMASGGKLDWEHLISRYRDHWQLLLSYLNLYAFIYPSHHTDIPEWVESELMGRLRRERTQPNSKKKLCRGTLLDRFSYNYDVDELGYVDSRVTYAKALGRSARDVVNERAWARDKIAKGEVYKEEGA